MSAVQEFGVDIQGLQFGVMSPDEIRSYSVCEITEAQQFENGRPVANGPFDLRMGSITRQLNCATCHRNKEECPGHFGHIELEVPVFNPFFMEQVKQILNCVCHRCSELLLVKDEAFLKAVRSKTNPKARAALIYDRISKKKVRVCGFCSFNTMKKKAPSTETADDSSIILPLKKSSKKRKNFSFTIGRAEQRLLKEKEKINVAPPVRGSGDIFASTVNKFNQDVQEMPTLDELKSAIEKRDAGLPLDVSPNSTLHHCCFSIQPKIVQENTNLFMVWPETDQLYSMLLNGTVEEEDAEEDPESTIESTVKEKDQEDNDEASEEIVKKKRKKKDDTAEIAEATTTTESIAPTSIVAAQSGEKKKRKKIKDADVSDVRRLLKGSPFSLPTSAQPGGRELLDAKQAYDILCRISPENCYLLGYDPLYAHPSWFIITCLPVIPPCSRKMVDTKISGSNIPIDDISFKLIQLVKKNNHLKKQRTFRDANYTNFQMLVTFHVMTLMNNKLRGQTVAKRTPKSAPLDSLSSDLKGKEGRIRGTMLGKRVDFSSRAVVGPGDGLRSDELGVPAKVARVETISETVNRFNIDYLQEAVNRGPKAYRGGANYVRTPDGVCYNLAVRKNIALRIGYSVDRHIVDGDIVVFNRQPSLHRMSMMGHRVVVHDQDNFQISLSATNPYNADFDGDEMNCHVAQSIAARVEISNLMMLPTQYISPQKNAPIMGIIQDILLAARLFTRRNMFFNRSQVCDFIMEFRHVRDCAETNAMFERKMPKYRLPMPTIVKPEALWTGKQILSLLLPEDLNYTKRSGAYESVKTQLSAFEQRNRHDAEYFDPSDTMTIVRHGVVLCGLLDKKSLGACTGSFVQLIFNDHGGSRCCDVIDAITRVLTKWIHNFGFSVGIEDMILKKDKMQHIDEIKRKALQHVDDLTQKLAMRQIEEIPGKSMEDSYEIMVTKSLNDCRDDIGNYVQQSLDLKNRLKFMETAGSKGNLTNLAAICGGFGQGTVAGKRIGSLYYGRTTPHALKKDPGDVEGRGFIASSYLQGLKPREFFNHNMSGREGLTNTAVKTSETGYIQRKLINTLADATVSYINGSVRGATGEIIQFIYGEDAMDGIKIEKQPFHLLQFDDQDMVQKYYVGEPIDAKILQEQVFPRKSLIGCTSLLDACQLLLPSAATKPLTTEMSSEQSEALSELRFLCDSRDYLRNVVFSGQVRDHLYLPKNLKRLIEQSKAKFPGPSIARKDVAAVRILLAKLLNRMMDSKNGPLNNAPITGSLFDRYRQERSGVEIDENTFCNHRQGIPHSELLAAIFVHYVLSPKRLLGQLSLNALEWVCNTYAEEYFHSRVHAGEAVGSIAAQSMGEPTTQMTLDSFHSTGVETVQLTLGLPRLKEIISAAKAIQTPVMSVFLKPEWCGAAGEFKIARKLAASMPEMLLENFLLLSDPPVHEELELPNTAIASDARFLSAAFETDLSLKDITFSQWSIRFTLNHQTLVQNQCTTTMIAATLRKNVGDWATVFHSDDNECDSSQNNNVGGIIRVFLHADPLERELDWQKPDDQSLLDPSSLQNTSEEEWKFACCEQYANQALLHCLTIGVCGITGISNAVPRKIPLVKYCPETGAVMQKQQQYVINTQGTNLREILTMEGVDSSKTICNHAIEVQKVLGIEAARAVLLEELRKVFQHCDSHVDYRYLSLLVDKMTFDGQVTPVSRHAFRKMLTGPYTRAAFEQQTDVLCDAGMFAEYEDGNDMRSAIMMGKHIPQGTGNMFDTICSLDSLLNQPSKTMDTIFEERKSIGLPKNPFGFTGIRDETKEESLQNLPLFDKNAVVSNPFFPKPISNPFLNSEQQQQQPMLASDVFEKKNSVFAPVTGKRYRPLSPSDYLK